MSMEGLPDLSKLSHEEKDILIRELWPLRAQVAQLTMRLTELEAQLAKNSRNSSKPPSSDGMKKPKSLRKAGQHQPGGQKGHPGSTLKRVAQPNQVVVHELPPYCEGCGASLIADVMDEGRQVFDLPLVSVTVTEHRIVQAKCTCGKVHRSTFPEAVTAPVQLGPNVKALVVYLTQHHMLPMQRTAQLIEACFGLPLSTGSVMVMIREAQGRLSPLVERIGEAITAAPVVGADETGLRVDKKIYWLHTAVTDALTWIGLHPRRGRVALQELGLLPRLAGIVVHDCWPSYRDLSCQHALCNAHLQRELTFVLEQTQQAWASEMIHLLSSAHQETCAAHGQPLAQVRIDKIRTEYEALLCIGEAANPPAPPTGQRGGTHQSFPVNLLRRLRDYADDVLRFTTNPQVPFTNNQAEQAIRMPKVKQKIAGCFRTPAGAAAFCTIRSYLATLQKQGFHLLRSLAQAFLGYPPEPHFT